MIGGACLMDLAGRYVGDDADALAVGEIIEFYVGEDSTQWVVVDVAGIWHHLRVRDLEVSAC